MHRCSAVPWQGVSLSQPHVCPWHSPHGLSSATAEAPGNNPCGLFREPGCEWMSLEVDMQLQILALPPSSSAAGSARAWERGHSAHTQFRALAGVTIPSHPIPGLPSHPGALPVPRDRYQELVCLVANRAAVRARRSCLCACGCSGNSEPAGSCQNPRWPGPSPRHSCPGAAWPAGPLCPARRAAREAPGARSINTTRRELSAEGVYCRAGLQRGSAASFGLGFTKAAGDLCRWPGNTKLSRGASRGWARSIPAAPAQRAPQGLSLPPAKRQSRAASRRGHRWGREEAAVV